MLKFLILLTFPVLALTHPTQNIMHSSSREKPSFPASYELFSSSFKQPDPPHVHDEFKCSWKQHFWSPTFSQITSGYLYHSHSQKKVRTDATISASIISSLFDYASTTADGLVHNTLYTLEPSVTAPPQIWRDFVKPAWPLFAADTLVTSNAVFGGVVEDRWIGTVASWKITYQDGAPVTVYLDTNNTVVGFDYHETESRTGIVNRYFNVELGPIDGRIFDFPKED